MLFWTIQKIFDDINELPIADKSIIKYIGRYGEKDGATDIINGRINKNKLNITQETFNVLSNMKYPNNIRKKLINKEMIREEYINTFCTSNEFTTSSPSGVHYFHYIATTFDNDLEEIMATKTSLPFQYAFKVDRWCQAHHIILPKTYPPQIHKLHNIQIIEEDYNSYFKCKINKKYFGIRNSYKCFKDKCMEESKINQIILQF